MILIADSGSTKTDWQIIDGSKLKDYIQTKGYNPYYQSTESIADDLNKSLFHKIDTRGITEICYYGAGCTTQERREKISIPLKDFFGNIEISIHSDLFGAARALCGRSPGIACALGTGSGSCYYDGKEIIQNIPSLGFILGDEGSGADLGKRLLRDYLRGRMPENIRQKLSQTYHINKEIILEKVNKNEMPSRYLAEFAKFITENLDQEYIFNTTLRSFKSFAENYIIRYPQYQEFEVHFIGSTAYFNQSVLLELGKIMSFRIGNIIRNPLEGLIKFHTTT